MTNMEKLIWQMQRSHRSALSAAKTITQTIVDHDDEFPVSTSNAAEAVAEQLETVARLLRDAIAIERSARNEENALSN